MTGQSDPVYVFDLDGVITDPANSRVNEEVVRVMHQLLATGSYLAVNTGRSFEWVEQNLLGQLRANGPGEIFDRFIAVCEKGGEMIALQKDQWSVSPSEFALPHNIYKITKATFDQNKEQLKSMFWDGTKRTMATIEKLPSADLGTFHAEQQLLVGLLSDSLTGHEIKLDATTIATDVESPLAGKHAGAQLVYGWIGSSASAADCSFICFGDSVSDYAMARYFVDQGAPSTFVYVGKPTDKIVHDERVRFVPTKSHYASGALEYLSGHMDRSVATK